MSGIDGLNAGDPGVGMLVDAVRGTPSRDVLLVHCGDLPGIAPGAQRLILDIRESEGAVADVVEERLGRIALPRPARVAIVWPRAHLGKDFTHWSLVRAADGVGDGGLVWCAVRKNKGADSVADAMRRLVGPVDVVGRSKGYRLLRAECAGKRDDVRAEVLAERYAIEDPELLPGVVLRSAPGVFSRRALDAGTAALIRHTLAAELPPPTRVVDLCAGIGPLAIAAARHWPTAKVTAVDSNVLAVSLARANVEALGLADRISVLAHDGMPAADEAPDIDLALVNPPTHADAATLERLWAGLRARLAPSARVMVVAARAGAIGRALTGLGAQVSAAPVPGYTIVDARF